ncbi:MAG: DUF2490 domain-containing protein [Flavobacteriales bacterium]|nr:DUF2490 domain-containing protein [Flavobacteriales bacterium]
MSKNYIFFIFLVIPFLAFSQQKDAKLRTAISFSKKVEDFKFSFSEEYRRNENFSQTDKLFSELEGNYKLLKDFTFGVAYRFNQSRNYEYGGFDYEHRICLDLDYELDVNDFEFSIRTRYQIGRELLELETLNRNKLSAKYKFSDNFEPSLSFELFYQFNQQNQFNRSRTELSGKFKISDNQSIKAGYMFENKFNRKNLEHNHIYFINYNIDL